MLYIYIGSRSSVEAALFLLLFIFHSILSYQSEVWGIQLHPEKSPLDFNEFYTLNL